MQYRDPKLRKMLAAEYVLGTLRGSARRRFERLAKKDAALRNEQYFWEQQFADHAQRLTPVAPAPTVWMSLQQRLQAGNTVPLRPAVPKPVPAALTPAPMWRIWAGLATAAAVVGVMVFTQYRNNPAVAPPQQTAQAGPSYVAALKLPGSDMQWTLEMRPQGGMMTASASGSYPQLGSHSLELWWISPQGPVALGLLPLQGQGSMPLPKGIAAGAITLAVSLEPAGGSPTGKPTGPVLTSGPATRNA